jgi:TRAP-type C4-dicarboxylate transport system permease small subunit
MIGAIITLIIYLLVIGLLYWLVLYVIDAIPIPDPPARIIKIALMVLMVLVIIVLLLNLLGVGTGLDVPKLHIQ